MPKAKAKYPKGVNIVSKRLSDGRRVRYGYFGRGMGAVPLGREGTAEFHERLADALRREPARNTVAQLVWKYRQSSEFLGLRERTRGDYLTQLDKVTAKFGELSLRAIAAREIVPHLFTWRDSMAQSPRRADYAVQVLKALLSWGVKRGHLDHNRAAGIGRLYHANRREKVWSDDQVTAFLSIAPASLQLALILALETGQRQGDLLIMPWSADQGDVIRLRQAKTGAMAVVPVSPSLRAALEGAPKGKATTILTRGDGLPWDRKGNGFRAAWREACKAAGVKGVTFHDLRGTFVTRRLSDGWSPQEVADCTGHSLRDLASLEGYADRGAVAQASAEALVSSGRGITK